MVRSTGLQAMKKQVIIALLTDFGSSDGYAAAMKGAVLSLLPGATIVDITHEVPPQGVRTAAYLLWSVYRFFPLGTIFALVVDPGVGSDRALCCTNAGGYLFLHPDNGIIDPVLNEESSVKSVELTNPRYWRPNPSATFHGRDILAPVAAALAAGTSMRLLGTPRLPAAAPEFFAAFSPRVKGKKTGTVIHIDRFGNLVTNFRISGTMIPNLQATLGRTTIRARFTHYAEAAHRRPFLLIGSTGLVEIALRDGNAATALSAAVGDSVTLAMARGRR